jgi:hypothetical protein
LWKKPIVREYIQEIEKANGILGHAWLDANIHAMIVHIIVPCAKHIGTFGYHHNKHVSKMNSMDVTWNDALPFHP